ncbi:MAG: SpoIIE family protein phosphatase [Kiritimatiellae bacterium]|nr:SpoIIE family protein phosphatase [Kiritimatiellia bacterium]
MDATETTEKRQDPKRHSSLGWILIAWLAAALPFVFLYVISHRAIINEIRHHVKGVAIASAAGIEEDLLEQIHDAADANTPAYASVQRHLARLIEDNSDVRFIYAMRRSPEPFSPVYAYQYIVDAPARDFDGDGKIGPDEVSQLPGAPYDASKLPAMVEAWERPSADAAVSPDPPYPDVISGYAPVRGTDGRTVAIIGVDITAHTVSLKWRVVQVVIVSVWLLIGVLLTLIVHLYYQQTAAFEEIKRLNEELAVRHELLRRTNAQLSELEAMHSWSRPSSGEPRMIFDEYYLRAALSGRSPAAVFDVDQDHVGFYLASISGASASDAMVRMLVRTALATLAERASAISGAATVYVDLQSPATVLRVLSSLVAKELPESESVSLIYGVVDLARNQCAVAVAGPSIAMLHWRSDEEVEVLQALVGPALCAGMESNYEAQPIALAEGGRLVLVDTTTLAPSGRSTDDALAALVAVAKRVKGRALLDQVARLAEPYEGVAVGLLAVEAR